MPPVPVGDDAFCIAVLGDFLGEDWGGSGSAEAAWTPRRATPDTVLNLTGLRPRLRVEGGAGGGVEAIEFSSLESFHPGDLFGRLSAFAPLREAREAAKGGRSLEEPVLEGGEPGPALEETKEGKDDPPGPDPSSGPGGSLLDAILDKTQPSLSGESRPGPGDPGNREELDAFVREVVQPHLIKADTDLPTRLAAVDEEASALMSSLLHGEAFQRIEGLWRSMVTLLSRVDTTGKVRVFLVHLPKSALARDLSEAEDALRSKLFGLLSYPDLGVQGRRWAVAVGAYELGPVLDDIQLLERIACVAQAADIPWFSSIQLGLQGDPERGGGLEAVIEGLPEEWDRFREREEAAWIGLTYPRFLTREPFGESPRRSKDFDFREAVEGRSDLLWGDGAFLCAALLAQGFSTGEWQFRPENHFDLGGMPLAGAGQVGEDRPTSVEIGLDVTASMRLMEAGLIPLMGHPERAAIRLGGFHSVAASGAAARAWWRR